MSTTPEDQRMSEAQPTTTDGDVSADAVAALVERVESLEERVQELEAENERLRDQVDTNTRQHVNATQVNHLLAALTGGDLDDFTADPMRHRDLAADFNARVGDLEDTVAEHGDVVDQLDAGDHGKGSGAWHAIVEEAKRCQGTADHDLPDNRVRLYCEDVSRATGKSQRMASNYIEDFGDAKRGTTWRPYKPPSNANGGEAQKKSLVVDLNVWGDADA